MEEEMVLDKNDHTSYHPTLQYIWTQNIPTEPKYSISNAMLFSVEIYLDEERKPNLVLQWCMIDNIDISIQIIHFNGAWSFLHMGASCHSRIWDG